MRLVDRDSVPTTGAWYRGDVVINSGFSSGEALYWICTSSGEPGTWVAVYTTTPADLPVGVGAKNGATVTAVQTGVEVFKTVLTLASTPVTVANTTGSSFGGVKLYDFPVGRILIHGVTANLSFNWAGTGIVATGSGDFSMGTAVTADATLDGTNVDLLPSTGLLDPFVAGVGTGKGALAASAHFDGTTTAIDAFLNLIIDDADVSDEDSSIVLVSGSVTITWTNLGDY